MEKFNLVSPDIQEAFDRMVTGDNTSVTILFPARVSLERQPEEEMRLKIVGLASDKLVGDVCKNYRLYRLERSDKVFEVGTVCKHHDLTNNEWVMKRDLYEPE